MEQPSLINFSHQFSLTADKGRVNEVDSDSGVEEYSGMEQHQLVNLNHKFLLTADEG